MKRANRPPAEARPTQPDDVIPRLASAQGMTTTISPSTDIIADALPETEVTKKLIPTDSNPSRVSDATSHDIPAHTSRDMHVNYSRLPKLHLPTFDGNPLQWQNFWDSFSAAVHSNPCLTGVQKFNYLHAQLQGDASRVIGGFPLSDTNYAHSVELLRERFGQQFKLVDAHMDAL